MHRKNNSAGPADPLDENNFIFFDKTKWVGGGRGGTATYIKASASLSTKGIEHMSIYINLGTTSLSISLLLYKMS